MLIRYPEVSSVRYEPENHALVFSFFLQGQVDVAKKNACLKDLNTCFEVCTELDREFPKMGNLTFTSLEDITIVMYHQEINQITTGEISLLTSILQNHFANEVALDPLMVDEDDMELQEELIDRLLGHRDILSEQKQIVAYRDGGKVFVYNR
ncbi:hypothetical protein ACFO8Q_03085 [Effusibacillus consociatus]|uniref:Uncharacterized protein n=2 Tax=Effusibacillus consociatus TaxID=1117041 RepID=A0ABV9PVV4_9BACL